MKVLILRVLPDVSRFPYTSGFQTVSQTLLTDCEWNLVGPHYKDEVEKIRKYQSEINMA